MLLCCAREGRAPPPLLHAICLFTPPLWVLPLVVLLPFFFKVTHASADFTAIEPRTLHLQASLRMHRIFPFRPLPPSSTGLMHAYCCEAIHFCRPTGLPAVTAHGTRHTGGYLAPGFTPGLPLPGGLLRLSGAVGLHPPLFAGSIVALAFAQVRCHLGYVPWFWLLQFWRSIVSQILPHSGHQGASACVSRLECPIPFSFPRRTLE